MSAGHPVSIFITASSRRIGKRTTRFCCRSFSMAVSTSFSTHSLDTELFESTSSNLSWTRIDSSMPTRIFSPIFRSSGAYQQRTPVAWRSAWSLSAKMWSLEL